MMFLCENATFFDFTNGKTNLFKDFRSSDFGSCSFQHRFQGLDFEMNDCLGIFGEFFIINQFSNNENMIKKNNTFESNF